jgi:acyl-CoA reductase-like NAD-dependent aldehyde dehydrogenase
MSLDERKEALLGLARSLDRILEGKAESPEEKALASELEAAYLRNPWFTPEQMRTSISSLSGMLTKDAIDRWTAPYGDKMEGDGPVRNVLLIMAGNIPFVGAQDILAVLLFGHRALVKPSSKEDRSLPRLLDLVTSFSPFQGMIEVLERPISVPDAVIATGSDNSGRYFQHYFGHLPHTFRGNRSGAAILEGDESEEELRGLLQDIFLFYGRGCRNVSKLYVPQDWDPSLFLRLTDEQERVKEHQKYMNNVAYHKAIYLMNGERFYDGGSVLLIEEPGPISPLGVLHFEPYSNKKQAQELIERDAEKLQCLVGRDRIPFGFAQFPELGDHEAEKDPLGLLAEL